MEATAHPERIPSHHPHAFADHSRQFAFSSLGNVNHREWTANVRKYLYGGDGALGEQASCLLCLLIHRCQTDFKQISVLHLSNICGQTGSDGALGEQASCLLCLLIHRCQTDFKQISVLHLSNICGQTGSDGALGEQASCLLKQQAGKQAFKRFGTHLTPPNQKERASQE